MDMELKWIIRETGTSRKHGRMPSKEKKYIMINVAMEISRVTPFFHSSLVFLHVLTVINMLLSFAKNEPKIL